MTFSRNSFFLFLLLVCITPFIVWKLLWLSKTQVTEGKVWFTGHTIQLDGAISDHLVILFMAGRDSVNFEAPTSLGYKEGQPVSIRYEPAKPSKARINTPLRIWGDAIVFGMWPVLVLLVIYLIPDSLDPLVPRKSRVRISSRRFIEIMPAKVSEIAR